MDVDDFFLMCAGKVMRGELTLSDQNVYQGARISLVGRLRGGMNSCEGKTVQGSNNVEAHEHYLEEKGHALCELNERCCVAQEHKKQKAELAGKEVTNAVQEASEAQADDSAAPGCIFCTGHLPGRPVVVPRAKNFGVAGELRPDELANFERAFKQLETLENLEADVAVVQQENGGRRAQQPDTVKRVQQRPTKSRKERKQQDLWWRPLRARRPRQNSAKTRPNGAARREAQAARCWMMPCEQAQTT